jgi:type IV pilus assembly protein PilM
LSDEKPTSIWKKEISFRRKPDDDVVDDFDEGGKTSIWKKELSLGRRKQEEPEAVEPVETALEPVLEPADEPTPEPVAPPEPTPVVLAPVPPVEHDWLTQPLEEVSEPPEPTPITLLPAAEPAQEPEPSAPSLIPELPPVAAAPPPAPAGPPVEPPTLELPPVELPAPEPLPVAVPVEVPVVAAAPVAEEPDVPFYKKELSLRRKPRAPKAPKASKPPREKPADEGAKTPFYKRDLSLKRKPKQWDAAEPAEAPKPKQKQKLSLPSVSLSLPSFSRGGGGNAKKIVGLKIGGSQIAAARVHNNGSPELVQAVRMPLEHGIVVGGELRDVESLAAALKEFFTQNKLPRRGVRLGIANNRIGVRTFEVAGIADPKQLANAVRFRAQEVLPIPIEEAVLDYQVLEESLNEEGQPVRRVLLVVAYRDLVDRYVTACRKAGLQLVGIDLEAFALLRAIAEPRDPVVGSDRGALVAVSVGHERSTFAVSDGRVCEFTRVLEWGGWTLNVAIARALDMSPSEVEPLKRSLSFAGFAQVPEGFTEEQYAAAQDAARKQLQTFARELVSSLQFYQGQPQSLGIGEIALTGGTAHLPGLGAELERLIGVPVRVADPLSRLKVSKKVREPEQVGSLAVAIGLGIED